MRVPDRFLRRDFSVVEHEDITNRCRSEESDGVVVVVVEMVVIIRKLVLREGTSRTSKHTLIGVVARRGTALWPPMGTRLGWGRVLRLWE